MKDRPPIALWIVLLLAWTTVGVRAVDEGHELDSGVRSTPPSPKRFAVRHRVSKDRTDDKSFVVKLDNDGHDLKLVLSPADDNYEKDAGHYRGFVEDHEGSQVFGSLEKDMFHGYVSLAPGDNTSLSADFPAAPYRRQRMTDCGENDEKVLSRHKRAIHSGDVPPAAMSEPQSCDVRFIVHHTLYDVFKKLVGNPSFIETALRDKFQKLIKFTNEAILDALEPRHQQFSLVMKEMIIYKKEDECQQDEMGEWKNIPGNGYNLCEVETSSDVILYAVASSMVARTDTCLTSVMTILPKSLAQGVAAPPSFGDNKGGFCSEKNTVMEPGTGMIDVVENVLTCSMAGGGPYGYDTSEISQNRLFAHEVLHSFGAPHSDMCAPDFYETGVGYDRIIMYRHSQRFVPGGKNIKVIGDCAKVAVTNMLDRTFGGLRGNCFKRSDGSTVEPFASGADQAASGSPSGPGVSGGGAAVPPPPAATCSLCSPHGDCVHGRCQCHAGWQGNDCNSPICVTPCVWGKCVGPDECHCRNGWSGDTCSTPECQCDNGGTCVSPGKCRCRPGYSGPTCAQQKPFCTKTCMNGGVCVAKDTCQCTSEYEGQYCSKPICSPSCKNGGVCVSPNQCQCPEIYSGTSCQIPVTVAKTSNSRKVTKYYRPIPGWGNRSKDYCGLDCQNGGRCWGWRNPVCKCPWGFSGTRCEHKRN